MLSLNKRMTRVSATRSSTLWTTEWIGMWSCQTVLQRPTLMTASWLGLAFCRAWTMSQEHLLSWMSVPTLPMTAGSP